MMLIGLRQVFNTIVIAIRTLFHMCCRSLTFSSSSSSAADSDVVDSTAVADDDDDVSSSSSSAADSDVVDSIAVAVADDDADIPPLREKYDVFINFRGEDTRLGITSHLDAALLQKKIETYSDKRLHSGEEIAPTLIEAIEKSTISVIIFSQNYASSTWCLDELVYILQCKERYARMVIPVFYDINPSDVRKQHGSYGDAFAQLEKRFDNSIDKVHQWRDALTTAANLSGFDYSNKSGTEADLIKNVVNRIWTRLICESSCDLEGLVGIESRIQQIEELLGIHSHDACIVVGIWGMGGIGKTTLAETVFHKLSSKFDASCFVKNVRENSKNADGLYHLEKTLLEEILKEKGRSMRSTFVRERLRRTKVLIVLDDVSDSIQLECLAGKRLQYGTGSRIIITSRDRSTLRQTVEEGKIYEVEELKPDEALQLFCSRAFKNNSTCRTEYKELAEKAAHYARGIPLALILLGSSFQNCNSKEAWEDELDKLKELPNEKLHRGLRLSNDGLGRNEEIFLDSFGSAADSDVADSTAVADDDADIPPLREKYDVYISFRGEDTHLGITSHLNAALLQKKIETNINNRFHRGEEIGPALLEAIEKSTISVIIFSQNYASSTWCLDELVHILECKERYGQMVVPVFYNIHPSDVRKQHGSYADAFARLEKRFDNGIDKVHKWRDALTNAANIFGFGYSNNSGTDADLVMKVVEDILTRLRHESSCDLEGLVGIESRIEQIESLLGVHSQDACISVGIWGMGGIGKTTLAEAVYLRVSSKFETCCFLRNVRDRAQKYGLEHLQNTLLSLILKEEGLSTRSTFVRDRLSRRKVLIVLDDVSDSMQMEGLAGNRLRFGPGSRIIITSRNRGTLRRTVEEDKIYEVRGLKPNEALQLFCSCAFKNNSTCRTVYKESVEKVVRYAGGLPLAIKVLGYLFFNCKSKEDWEDEFNKLEEFPNENIQRVLRISYDELYKNEKEIFLDIACFHKGRHVDEVKQMLVVRGYFATAGLRVLIDLSLISIHSKWGTIEMHDLLKEMGRTIVNEQCIEDPGKRNRLFNDEDVYHVLESNRVTPNVEVIRVNWYQFKERPLKRADFNKMPNLKMLIAFSSDVFGNCSKFTASLDLSDSLRYLYWRGYPLESLPSNFSTKNLVQLHMPYSKVKKLWKEDQRLVNLEVIDLHHSKYLIEVPNLSGSPKIVDIDLFGCESLVEIPRYFQHLDKLTCLDLGGCSNLKYLPEMPGSIKYLDLHDCTSLGEFSELP